MAGPVLSSIVHATDFSDVSNDAFAHALRIALAARCALHIVHVDGEDDEPVTGDAFPHVRALLAKWGLMDESEPQSHVDAQLGIRVSKLELSADEPGDGMARFLSRHGCELLVLGTGSGSFLRYAAGGSVAEKISRESRTTTLFVKAGSRGLVDLTNGDLFLSRILMPIDQEVPWIPAYDEAARLANFLNPDGVEIRLLHIGHASPAVPEDSGERSSVDIKLRSGQVVEEIVAEAIEFDADLIIMPTAGHHGFLDTLRGSTTERVLHRAPCPVLAIPAK